MSELIELHGGKRTTLKPPPVERIVVITPTQDKLFYFVMGVFCGANWIAAMAGFIRWIAIP